MVIKRIKVGSYRANCYIIIKDKACLVVDPGDEYERIIEYIGNLELKGILITHYHFDHVGALKELLSKYNVSIYDYKKEGNNVVDIFNFDIIINKGHASDCVSFYFKDDKILFTGDFLFKGTIGRTDLETSNDKDMYESLKMIRTYAEDIIIYPGHGHESTLGYEFKNNPYLREFNH